MHEGNIYPKKIRRQLASLQHGRVDHLHEQEPVYLTDTAVTAVYVVLAIDEWHMQELIPKPAAMTSANVFLGIGG